MLEESPGKEGGRGTGGVGGDSSGLDTNYPPPSPLTIGRRPPGGVGDGRGDRGGGGWHKACLGGGGGSGAPEHVLVLAGWPNVPGGGGGVARGHGVGLFAFGGAYWPLAIVHSDPPWVRTCCGHANGAPKPVRPRLVPMQGLPWLGPRREHAAHAPPPGVWHPQPVAPTQQNGPYTSEPERMGSQHKTLKSGVKVPWDAVAEPLGGMTHGRAAVGAVSVTLCDLCVARAGRGGGVRGEGGQAGGGGGLLTRR